MDSHQLNHFVDDLISGSDPLFREQLAAVSRRNVLRERREYDQQLKIRLRSGNPAVRGAAEKERKNRG